MQIKTSLLTWVPVLLIGASTAYADVRVYSAIPLIGTEEVPAVITEAYGVFTGMYDDTSNVMYYSFEWSLESGATGAHFHGPAERGQIAGVLVNLGPVSGETGMVSGSVELSESEEAQLLAGLWYINVHSSTNLGGEIRGQVVELSPAATAAVYDVVGNRLVMNSVIVPGLGVFEAELGRIEGRSPLSVELQVLGVKDLDSAPAAPDQPDPEAGMPYPG